uniref:Uncharacterized protein n=1 Tax=Siphoviridae sp. ctnOB2 TaxID=2825661 RepID=A0A8S5PEH6_9CAUD|nr:MAG TPA: hypothetical protein [Siphoviridae sp. ctnOB2]DAQ05869.1 MAG TPA: hypothetical protein [Caudoviricetes sp.]
MLIFKESGFCYSPIYVGIKGGVASCQKKQKMKR